jgi:hypothetical protein
MGFDEFELSAISLAVLIPALILNLLAEVRFSKDLLMTFFFVAFFDPTAVLSADR